jgi:two-component system, NarL family, response regulator LiaR
MAVRVLIADDHDIVRRGLRMILALDAEIEIVGEVSNGAQAVHAAARLRPDVVLMDLLMPELDGVEATRQIRGSLPEVQVLALTSVVESGSVVDAVRAGAVGYVLKDGQADELPTLVRAAAAGQIQLAPKVAACVVQEVRAPQRPDALSTREVDVLRLLGAGLPNKQIGRELSISEKTVKAHVSAILAKLGLDSRTQAALEATRRGLISPVSALPARG